MKKKSSNFLKIVIFNLILSGSCIYLFSPGLAGLIPSSTNSTKRILFFVAIVAVCALFIGVNYALLSPKKVKLVDKGELKAPKDYIKSLQDYSFKTDFEKQISILIGQIRRLSPKQAALDVILEQNFDKSEMTYIKFKTTIDEVVNLFFENIKKAINRIGVFDEEEFRKLKKNELNLPEDSRELKMQIYTEHINYVDNIIKRNEDIITLLDNLMLEISKLDDISSSSMESIQIIAEMRELIKNTKFYG